MNNKEKAKRKKIIDILRKIGVLRYGTKKGTYRSVREMPAELFMADVYDAKKDLVTKKDIETALKKIKAKLKKKK